MIAIERDNEGNKPYNTTKTKPKPKLHDALVALTEAGFIVETMSSKATTQNIQNTETGQFYPVTVGRRYTLELSIPRKGRILIPSDTYDDE